MKRYILYTVLSIAFFSKAYSQEINLKSKKSSIQFIDKNLTDAAKQYDFFEKQIPKTAFPKTLDKSGKLVTSNSEWWCSGFYPGTLIYLYEDTKQQQLFDHALSKMQLLKKEQFNKGTHDLGFMMYCSFGNANRLTPKAEYDSILVNSAKSLSTRFSPITGCIRSWDPKKANDYIVIIDNMMNLELLFYATKVTGDSSYYKIAISHANHTMKNHFRPDYSSFHVVDYNPQTGEVDNKRTHQGAANSSAWARGQGWALYGYTIMYRETKDKKYLNFANNIASFILNNPHLPKDKIPYWDFDAPNIPNEPRDASAGALIASSLIELATYNKGKKANIYLKNAAMMLNSLSSYNYKSKFGENEGFILDHSVGSLPHKSEVDVPLTYADYYYVEALVRFKKFLLGSSIL